MLRVEWKKSWICLTSLLQAGSLASLAWTCALQSSSRSFLIALNEIQSDTVIEERKDYLQAGDTACA